MATRLVAAVGFGGLAWALGALALVVLTGGAIEVPTGISWT
ncbi:hypothetical protein [Sphaerisporangium dianthi]|uniref:Uncharacterized protein n=1 Tax=Sphaerisporangium dianthi TaxID=1436120 RepID=A0ABV9CTC9_9ACTN